MRKCLSLFFVFISFSLLGPATAGAQSFRELYEKGETEYHSGNYAQAIQHYEKAVEVDPNFAPVYNALGLAHQAIQDPLSDVIWFFKVAVDIDPQNTDAYHNMCRVYYQAGKHNEAEQACRKALAINPELAGVKLSLAWIYLVGKQQPADAILYFNDVAEKVQSPMVYFGLGLAYAQNNERARVLEVITLLRHMGENNLARQLERSIVNPEEARISQEQFLYHSPSAATSGHLVESTPKPKPAVTNAPAGGGPTMKIRLKGTLNTIPQADDGTGRVVPTPTPFIHPGSLSPE